MNRIYMRLLGMMIAIIPFGLSAQTYVKADAAGNNDGTSWADAYTNLGTAIDNAAPGAEIWVASGTYKVMEMPAQKDTAFFITRGMSIYGGFAGTETDRSEADPANNTTTLTADVNGDDMMGNFDANRIDNTTRIFFVDTMEMGESFVLDGFNLMGATPDFTDTMPDGSLNDGLGGAMLATGLVKVSNCNFTNNYAGRGGGAFMLGARAADSEFSDCTFTGNRAIISGGGLRADATFTNLIGCSFSENETETGSGGAVIMLDAFAYLSECSFDNNTSGGQGGAMLFTAPVIGVEDYVFENCSFTNNVATSWGGSSVCFDCDYIMRDCNIEGNSNLGLGRAAAHIDVSSTFLIERTTIQNNEAAASSTGANEHEISTGTYRGCTFDNNSSSGTGGAMFIGFIPVNVTFEDCTFTDNTADSGGAIRVQNAGPVLTLKNTVFENNEAGAAGAVFTTQGVNTTVEDCTFTSNDATESFGGALYQVEDSLNVSDLVINRTFFTFNNSVGQGGALNLGNTNAIITNCAFGDNTTGGDDGGRGGAISLNASGTTGVTVEDSEMITEIINCTFFDNIGDDASTIAHWEEPDSSDASSEVLFQNNIFMTSDFVTTPIYWIEDGLPEATSLGGNLIYGQDGNFEHADGSMDDILTEATDIIGMDPMMESPIDGEYVLMAESPGINAGVADGAPETDILGNPRDNFVDIGSFENTTVNTRPVLAEDAKFTVLPNPVSDLATLRLDNEWSGDVIITVSNKLGQVVKAYKTQKTSGAWNYELSVRTLPDGMYQVGISNGSEMTVQSIVKF